jgi:hypothetical protein
MSSARTLLLPSRSSEAVVFQLAKPPVAIGDINIKCFRPWALPILRLVVRCLAQGVVHVDHPTRNGGKQHPNV